MARRAVLFALGGSSFLIAGIATLPASVIAPHLGGPLQLEDAYGSIWSGGADRVSIDGTPLGAIEWQAHPLELLHGRLAYHLVLRHPQGSARGELRIAPGGRVTIDAGALELPVTALDPAPGASAWQGTVAGTIKHARLADGWPVELEASFTLSGVRPPGADFEVGSFALDFDPAASKPDALIGRIRDLAGPLTVHAQLFIKRERTYLVEGEVTAKPDAPPPLVSTLAFLGPPDALGRRGFSISGVFQTAAPGSQSRQPPSSGK
jgi:hypothetical protein